MKLHELPTIDTVGAPYVDLSAALKAFNGDRGSLAELAGLFATQYPDVLNEARVAAFDGDAQRLSTFASDLRGLLVELGAGYAAALAGRLAIHEGGVNHARVLTLLDDLDLELRRVREFYVHAGYLHWLC